MEINKYHCSQQELYTIATRGWNNCRQHLPAFANFRTSYTDPYIAEKLAQIIATSELPDHYQRTESTKIHHIQLIKETKEACTLYQKLKRYIIPSFPPDQQAIRLNSAGQQYYTAASNNNWEAVQAMLNNAAAFIIANTTILQNNGGMPTNFGTIVTTAKNNFTVLHQAFLNDEETQKLRTSEKIKANNVLYAILILMFLDGQEIFKNNPEIRSQFIFEHCLYLVRGAGIAGLRGHVNDSTTNLPIPSAIIQVGIDNYTATSDSDGFYQISPAAAGKYSITVTAPGYQPLAIPAQAILSGTISTLNLLLNPVIEPEL